MILLVLYGLSALINIYSIQCERRIIRLVSKICLMPVLLLFYILKSENFSYTIILAIIFSWCGDILLIKPRKPGLYAGIISFLTAHIFYIIMFIDLIYTIDIIIFIFSFLFLLSIECFLMVKLCIPNHSKLFIIIYGIAISLLVVFSLQVFVCQKNFAGILLVLGSVSFFISDAVLAYFSTIKLMTKNSLTVVMLSYSAAQSAIVIGCAHI